MQVEAFLLINLNDDAGTALSDTLLDNLVAMPLEVTPEGEFFQLLQDLLIPRIILILLCHRVREGDACEVDTARYVHLLQLQTASEHGGCRHVMDLLGVDFDHFQLAHTLCYKHEHVVIEPLAQAQLKQRVLKGEEDALQLSTARHVLQALALDGQGVPAGHQVESAQLGKLGQLLY